MGQQVDRMPGGPRRSKLGRAVERSEEQEGIILFTDPVECDACEERDE